MAPTFLIVLPLRNGGNHLKDCVRSVLGQTYPHFELAVLDNASTDASVEWLRAIPDTRISIHLSPIPLSIEENWARIKCLHFKHDFMTLIGHDDMLDPDFLECIRRAILEEPRATLYHAHFRLIDDRGAVIRACLPMPRVERSYEFLRARLTFNRDSFGTGYVFRCADYLTVGGIPGFDKLLFADDALWINLMDLGHKITSRNECFSYRVHAGSTSYSPEWEFTYRAADMYLSFLRKHSLDDPHVASVLRHNLAGFMLYLFRMGYFSANSPAGNREAVMVWIDLLIPKVQALIDVDLGRGFVTNVHSYLTGPFSRIRWISWRTWIWARRRALSLFSRRFSRAAI